MEASNNFSPALKEPAHKSPASSEVPVCTSPASSEEPADKSPASSEEPAHKSSPDTAHPVGASAKARVKLVALSKMVEYPGNPSEVQRLLDGNLADPAGADMFGMTALMKFAAWDKVDLLEILVNALGERRVQAINAQSPADGFTALHHAADMGATRTFDWLLKVDGVKQDLTDKKGRTAADIIKR